VLIKTDYASSHSASQLLSSRKCVWSTENAVVASSSMNIHYSWVKYTVAIARNMQISPSDLNRGAVIAWIKGPIYRVAILAHCTRQYTWTSTPHRRSAYLRHYSTQYGHNLDLWPSKTFSNANSYTMNICAKFHWYLSTIVKRYRVMPNRC